MVKTWVEAGKGYDGVELGQESPGFHVDLEECSSQELPCVV